MAHRELEGVPAFSGDAVKARIELGGVPTFDPSFDVKIHKVQPSTIPSFDQGQARVTRVPPQESSFDDAAEVLVHRSTGG